MSEKSLTSLILQPVRGGMVFLMKVLTKVHNKIFTSQAKSMNWQIYSDVWTISKEEMEHFESEMRYFAKQRDYGPEYVDEFLIHRYRLFLSMKWLQQALSERGINQAAGSLEGLEMGGITIVTDLLAKNLPQVHWQNTSGDARYTWENPDASADIIVSMEVLEHLSDTPDGINDGFYATGMKAALRESYRVLKPGGIMFVTTPNAASAFNLISLFAGRPSWLYVPHVREYTLFELQAALQEAGFKIQRARTVHCLSIGHDINYTYLFQTLLGSLVDTKLDDRGDDLFIVAVK